MNMEQVASYLEMGMWCVVAFLMVIGALKGRSRGLFRQIVRSATIVASFYISLMLAKYIYTYVSTLITKEGAEGLITTLGGYGISVGDFSDILVSLGADSINHVLAIPMALIILPLIFVLSFMVFNFLLRIIHAVICRIFGFYKWRNNFLTRLLGMALGALQGFAVALICLSPIVGLTSNLSTAVTKFESSESADEASEEVKKIYNEFIKPLTKNSCATTLAPLGADMIYEKITTLEVNGKEHNIPEELTEPTLRLVGVLTSIGDFDFANMTDESKNALNTIIGVIDDSPYMATLFADVLDLVAREFEVETGENAGDNPLESSIEQILSIFIDIEPENVASALELVRDSLFLTNMNYMNFSEDDRAAFNTLIESADEDEYKAEALAKILDAIAEATESPSLVSDTDLRGNLIKTMFSIFIDIPGDEVVPTLEVVRDALFMLDDEGALAALGQNTSSLSTILAKKDADGTNLITRLTDKFNSHERTKPLVESMTKLSIKVISESMPKIEGVEINEETYDSVKGGVNNGIVNINQKYQDVELVEGTPEYEEYVTEVSDSLSATFVENGISVDKPVADEMAKYIADNHKDQVEELSDEEINDIILSYYAAHQQTQPSPEVPEN